MTATLLKHVAVKTLLWLVCLGHPVSVADVVAVDDAVVEKLLQLLSDVHTADGGDNVSKAEISLKSVAGMLYRQHRDIDTIDNDAVDCENVLQMSATADVIVSSTANFFHQRQMPASHFSSGQLPFTTTSSVAASSNAASDVDCVPDSSVSCHLDRLGWNFDCLPSSTFFSTSSTAVAPHFCIPTVPVISPPQRGRHVCNTVGSQNVLPYRDQQTTKTGNSLSDTTHYYSSTWTSMPNTWPSGLHTAFQSLYPHAALPSSVPGSLMSTSQPVMPSDRVSRLQQSIHSEARNRTVISTREAMCRVHELLTAQCKVLVLMRGLPGSGKSTLARFYHLSVLS